jgi:hypothetical protein
LGAVAAEHAPVVAPAFFSTPRSREGLGFNVFHVIPVVGIDDSVGCNAESSLPELAMTTANTCGDARRVPAKDPVFVISASRTKRCGR